MSYATRTTVDTLLGQTLTDVQQDDDEEITFTLVDGRVFRMYHDQSCCEDVTIEDVCGDLNDLIGFPLTMAEESTSDEHPPGYVPQYEPDSFTWTFYRFATVKGYVTIRWYGESNGYYSESVSFEEDK